MNKFLSCYVDKVVVCFEVVIEYFLELKVVMIGNL